MITRLRQLRLFLTLACLAAGIAGCSSIGPTIGDTLPQWAGGLPKDVPPRRGTPEYDAYMKEREQKRLEPAPPVNANASAPANPSGTSLGPVH